MPEGETPRERLQSLLALSNAELTQCFVEWVLQFRQGVPECMNSFADFAGVPVGEIVASPFAFRSALMGIGQGIATVHSELRTQEPWASAACSNDPSIEVPEDVWVDGVVQEGKYTSFLQDGPFITLNPNHQSRWTAHEFVHRIQGFFFRPDMSRWELYLGARLNEALPVALWYGFDLVARLKEEGWEAREATLHPGASEEDALWLFAEEEELRAHVAKTIAYLKEGIAWVTGEWDAVREEVNSGVQVIREGGFLNGSSDATAYVVAHWNRLSHVPVQRVLSEGPRLNRESFSSVGAYLEQVENTLDRLLFSTLEGSLTDSEALREGRIAWDEALWRAIREESVGGKSEEFSRLARKRLDGTYAEGEVPPRFETDEAIPQMGLAWSGEDSSRKDWEQLVRGLESILPVTVHALSESDPDAAVLTHFVEAGFVSHRASLAERFAAALKDFDVPFLSEMARFEWLLSGGLSRSDQVERLSMDIQDLSPEGFAAGRLVANPHFQIETLSPDILDYHGQVMGMEAEPGLLCVSVYLVGNFGGNVVVLPSPPPVAGIWLHFSAGMRVAGESVVLLNSLLEGTGSHPDWPQTAEEWIRTFVDVGALSWSPPVRR